MSPNPANHRLQLVPSTRDRATETRDRILAEARNGSTTRLISSRCAVSERRVTAVIAEELEYARQIDARLEVMFLPAVQTALRETLRDAREDARELAA